MKKSLASLIALVVVVLSVVAFVLTHKPERTMKFSAMTADSAGQLAEGVAFTVGTNPTDVVTCVTTATAPVCEIKVPSGTYSVVARKSGYVSMNSLITAGEDRTSMHQMFLTTLPVNRPQPGNLVPIADFVLEKGASQSMMGLIKKYDDSLQPVEVPYEEIALSVVTGSSVTVNRLVLTASATTTGGTKIRLPWNNGTPGDTSDDKALEFTVVAY